MSSRPKTISNPTTITYNHPQGSFELKTEAGKTLWKMEGLKRPFPTFKAVDFESLGEKLAKEL